MSFTLPEATVVKEVGVAIIDATNDVLVLAITDDTIDVHILVLAITDDTIDVYVLVVTITDDKNDALVHVQLTPTLSFST